MKIYFDNDMPAYIDDLAPTPAPVARPARQPVRNWQVAVVYAMIHTGVMTTAVMLVTGDNALGMMSLAIHGAALFIGLCNGLVFRLL